MKQSVLVVADPVRRAVGVGAQALVVGAALVASGRALDAGGAGQPLDRAVNRWLAERRTPALDRVSWAVSTITDTPATIAIATTLAGVLWLRHRVSNERALAVAVTPLVAISLETSVFMSAAARVGRERPAVTRLDRPAHTTSYPSGHTAAATAMYGVIAGLLPRGRSWAPARAVMTYAVPPAVAWSRLYRGMHHPSDVVAGILLGEWTIRATRRLLG